MTKLGIPGSGQKTEGKRLRHLHILRRAGENIHLRHTEREPSITTAFIRKEMDYYENDPSQG